MRLKTPRLSTAGKGQNKKLTSKAMNSARQRSFLQNNHDQNRIPKFKDDRFVGSALVFSSKNEPNGELCKKKTVQINQPSSRLTADVAGGAMKNEHDNFTFLSTSARTFTLSELKLNNRACG